MNKGQEKIKINEMRELNFWLLRLQKNITKFLTFRILFRVFLHFGISTTLWNKDQIAMLEF